jgi:hypothetical protein
MLNQGQGKGQNLVKKTHTRRSVLEQGPDLEKTVKKGPAVGPAGTARKGPDPKIEAQKTADQKDLDPVKAKKVVVENTDPDLEIITTEAAAEDLDLNLEIVKDPDLGVVHMDEDPDLDQTKDIQEKDLDHEIDLEIVTRKPTEKSRDGIQILQIPQARTHLLHPDLEEFRENSRDFRITGFPGFLNSWDFRIPRFPDSQISGFPDFRIPRFPDSQIPRIPRFLIPGNEKFLQGN